MVPRDRRIGLPSDTSLRDPSPITRKNSRLDVQVRPIIHLDLRSGNGRTAHRPGADTEGRTRTSQGRVAFSCCLPPKVINTARQMVNPRHNPEPPRSRSRLPRTRYRSSSNNAYACLPPGLIPDRRRWVRRRSASNAERNMQRSLNSTVTVL